MSAGAILMTTCLRGIGIRLYCNADMMRSWLSLTALSGNPTRKNLMPCEILTSIVTKMALMPCTAAPNVFTSMNVTLFGCQKFYWLARITNCHTVIRNIFNDHTARTNSHVTTNGYAGQNGNISANPHIIADGYRFGDFDVLIPRYRIGWMADRINAYIRCNKTMMPNGYFSLVEHNKIIISKKAIAHFDMTAIVAIK